MCSVVLKTMMHFCVVLIHCMYVLLICRFSRMHSVATTCSLFDVYVHCYVQYSKSGWMLICSENKQSYMAGVAEAFCNWSGGWMDVSAGLNATVIFLLIISSLHTCIMSEIMSTFAV